MQYISEVLSSFDATYKASVFEQLNREKTPNITTDELIKLATEICANWANKHTIYAEMASKISISNLHRVTSDSFINKVERFAEAGMLNEDYVTFCLSNAELIEDTIDYAKDYNIDYFGLSTLKNGYLLRIKNDNTTRERPQDLWMRVSLFLNMDSIERALSSYLSMANKEFTHATPTLFHAGLSRAQMLSCFLIGMDDSIDGIFDTVKDCAAISKWAGGIGLHLSNIRGKGSWINGTNMESPGIVPMMQVLNQTIRYLNQNNKRHSSVAAYLEPWHIDVEDFLDIRTNTGDQELKCRDIFTAMWMPDLFMEHVENDLDWHLFSPDACPALYNTWGNEFRKAYHGAVIDGKYSKVIKARALWGRIVASQIETGTPYIVYKDASNAKSNQQNLGTIRSSNLCAEIVQYSDSKSFSCCTLASIGLPAFVDTNTGQFDFDRLHQAIAKIVRNLDSVIDLNYYPVERTRASNNDYRPLGIGVQGLTDVFQMLGFAIESEEAKALNRKLFEHIYFAAITESCKLAKERGSYKDFETSPAAQGLLSYDLWGSTPTDNSLDWAELKKNIENNGLRHSLLVACMPTASTSQILGNTECFEPQNTNVFTRRTLTGEYIVTNKLLMKTLEQLGLWTPAIQHKIMQNRGSIQNIDEIPDNIKENFKTVWEISQKVLIDLAADRGPFVDQSQSLNLFLKKPTVNKISSMHFYAWKKGLKTGIYYLRSQGAGHAEMFSVQPNNEVCEMCSA